MWSEYFIRQLTEAITPYLGFGLYFLTPSIYEVHFGAYIKEGRGLRRDTGHWRRREEAEAYGR